MSVWTIAATVIVCIVVFGATVFAYTYSQIQRFVDQCIDTMSLHRFMTPCEIARARAVKHGIKFATIQFDEEMVRNTFVTLEEYKEVIGREHVPDEICGCNRAYCLTYGTPRRKRFKSPRLEWVPDFVPKPA